MQKNQQNMLSALDFVGSLDSLDNLDELFMAFRIFIQNIGWSTYGIGDLVNPRTYDHQPTLFFSSWPEEWKQRWMDQDYMLDDPVVIESLRGNLPFFWSDIRPHQRGIGGRIMDEGREFNLFEGLCIPIKSPYGPKANITLAGDGVYLSKEELHSLHLACIYFFSKVEALFRDPTTYTKRHLSNKERECLHWVSSGKSDWETGIILNISQHTARSYVSSAMKKLGATTRVQAVALALRQGEIVP